MIIDKDCFYTDTHEWIKFLPDGTALVGLSDHAQEELGDIAFVNLCEEGETLTKGESFGDLESIKAVSDIFAPTDGKVIEINSELVDNPEQINSSPYESWLVRIECLKNTEGLKTAEEYEKSFEDK